MALFTIAMGYDIWQFGTNMSDNGQGPVPKAFGIPGKIVLVGICGLIVAGWIFTAQGHFAHK